MFLNTQFKHGHLDIFNTHVEMQKEIIWVQKVIGAMLLLCLSE